MEKHLNVRENLPVHNLKDSRGRESGVLGPGSCVLRIDGLVDRCLELTLADLEQLPQLILTEDFTCLEGWTVPNVKWSGVLLETVLSLADPHREAHYVQASAGEFSLPLPLEAANRALLAIRLGGDALTAEHGGPVRLVVPGGDCFMQIKWLDHLELRSEASANTAKTIALGRLPRRPAASKESDDLQAK